MLVLKLESFTHKGFPSTATVLLPWAVSAERATFGYGSGMGPAGLGVLQTSGNATDTPLESLVTTDILLTPTVLAMAPPFPEHRRGNHPPVRFRDSTPTPLLLAR